MTTKTMIQAVLVCGGMLSLSGAVSAQEWWNPADWFTPPSYRSAPAYLAISRLRPVSLIQGGNHGVS